MTTIRLAKNEWAKAWRAMIEIGPVRLVADDPVYEVMPAHVDLLKERGFAFEIVKMKRKPDEKRRHGKAN